MKLLYITSFNNIMLLFILLLVMVATVFDTCFRFMLYC